MSFCCMTKRILVACCFSVSLFCSESNGTNKWPSMALDGTPEHPEPQALVDYHRQRVECAHAYCFMPKNEEEIKLLYSLYSKGEFPGWDCFTMDMGFELGERIDIGDMYFIDKYIEHIEKFASLMAAHPDNKFVGGLFNTFGIPNTLGECGVRYAWSTALVKRGTLSKTEALYIMFRLSGILDKIGRYPMNALIDAYFTKNFPKEVTDLFEGVRKMYEERNLTIPERLK